jgi:large repetitive protein
MRILRTFVLLVLAATSVFAKTLPNYDAAATKAHPVAAATSVRSAAASFAQAGTVPQVNEVFNLPTFLRAQRRYERTAVSALAIGGKGTRPEETAAREHLGAFASLYHLTSDDIASTPISWIHNTGKGAIIVNFRQSISGYDVFREEMKVIMDQNLDLLALSGFVSSATQTSFRSPINSFRVPPASAISTAVADLAGLPFDPALLESHGPAEGGYQLFGVVPEKRASSGVSQDIRMKSILFHLPDGLEPAYYIEVQLDHGTDSDYFSYVISAADGSILFRNNLTASDSYNYKVFASTTGLREPFDSPNGNADTPHPTAVPDGFQPPFVLPNLVSLQNGPISTNDPWLPPGSIDTNGNNSDAYADLLAPDGFSAGDFRASITSPNTFDRTYDTSLNPNVNTTQQMAAITQLFYDVNFFHDWYYDVGFDEVSGNAQANNYGRGGVQGDNVRTEAQDNSGRNNANMSTPSDGGRPRMQMFIFDGFAAHNVTYVTPRAGTVLNTGTAAFGPNAFNIPATDVVLVNDGVGTTSDGCETPFVNAAAIVGKIALIDRGICGFSVKAANAKANGALAVIIANNVAGVINMAPTAGFNDNIATLSIGGGPASDTTTLKADLLAGPVQMTMLRGAALDRDGTIDNQIVAHEWCHYLSNRLIGNANGLSNNTGGGMGEGWSDFAAMLLTVKADDTSVPTNATFNGVYALAGYVEGGLAFDGSPNNGYYFGIRRVPYSTDMTKDPLSYRHIANGQTITGAPISFGADGANNAEVHNIGEVWTTMLWECYASLLRDTLGPTPRLTFDQARDRMRGYLVASLKMTPGAPTILEARDALLTAARATDMTDYGLFWAAFAKRGAGTEAQAPDRYSTTNTVGLVESAISGNDLVFSAASIVDSTSCDNDKSLDANETGTLGITLRNVGGVDLPAGATGTITSTTPGVTFPSGNTITFGSSTAGGTTNGGVQVALGPVIGIQTLSFQLSLSVPALPTPITSTANFSLRGNVDELPASSATEDFESSTTALPWTTMGSATTPSAIGRLAFRRIETTPTSHSIFAPDLSEAADVSFASPSLAVNTGTFSFSFRHRYQFEAAGTTFFDGGTIEISTDGGGTWTDIGSSIAVTIPPSGYTGTVALSLSTPFSGKPAFVGTSAGFPSFITTTVNLGTAFALKTVRIRFRAASDSNTGTSSGWEIDDVVFNNVTNLPFTRVAVDPGCSLTRTTTTTISSSPANPVAIGQRFSVTASVTSSDGAIPSGAIQFTIPGAVTPTILATVNLNAAGQTTAIFTSSGAATFNFSANYIPAFPTKFGPSTSAATPVVVGQGTTTTVLTSSLNPSTFGQSVTLTATVTAPGTAPTGFVIFRDGGAVIGAAVALAGGAASVTLTGPTLLSGGTHSLSATYNGATCCTSSVGNLTQTVNPAATFTTVISSKNISSAGEAVTFTATVTSGVLGTITGTVNFMDGLATIGAGTISGGTASFTTSTLSPGSHSITAVYAGDGNFASSSSPSIPQVVSGVSSLTLTAPATAITGVSFSVTVTVRDAANNLATGYAGTVHFSSTDPASVLPANYTFLAADAGTHTFSVILSTGGTRSITATDTVTGSLTSTATLIVNPAVIFARNDFNGDHLSDIIWQHSSSGQAVEWQMNGNVMTSSAVVDNPLATWVIKATGDFDGDGNADIILQNTATNAVAEWRMNGNVIVNGTIFNTPAAGWSVVATGDFNGDGKSDILLQNSFTGQVAEWQMNGSTITLGVVIANPGTAWSVKATGDFNGDGKSDILLQNSSTGDVAEWQMNGSTITSGLVFAAPGTTWVVKGTGDLDADGRSDIVLQNTTTGSVAEWLMNGNVITGGFVIGEPGLSSDVKGTADFNGDGRADIVLQNTLSNDVTIWQMNGRSITSSAVIGSPGTGFVPIVK